MHFSSSRHVFLSGSSWHASAPSETVRTTFPAPLPACVGGCESRLVGSTDFPFYYRDFLCVFSR